MLLMWKYAEATGNFPLPCAPNLLVCILLIAPHQITQPVWLFAAGNEKWKGMTWGMMPLFAGALSACTYHFFYNNPKLDFLVALQAGLTWIGNATLWAAAYRIYKDSQTEKARPR